MGGPEFFGVAQSLIAPLGVKGEVKGQMRADNLKLFNKSKSFSELVTLVICFIVVYYTLPKLALV